MPNNDYDFVPDVGKSPLSDQSTKNVFFIQKYIFFIVTDIIS